MPGKSLSAPTCTKIAALPTPAANTMVSWHQIELPPNAFDEPSPHLGELLFSGNEILVTGTQHLHRIDLRNLEICSLAKPSQELHWLSAVQLVPNTQDPLVVFRKPKQKEGAMVRYLDRGKRYQASVVPNSLAATALLALPSSDTMLASFPGILFSTSEDQGKTWTGLQTRQNAIYSELLTDRNQAHVWAFGKDVLGNAQMVWSPKASLRDAFKSSSAGLAKWQWDAEDFESVVADPHADNTLLVGTTSSSSNEALLARIEASPENNALTVQELWVGPSTTTFTGITAISPMAQPNQFILGGKAKKAGSAVLAYYEKTGKTQEISVDTDRKLRVLDIQPLATPETRRIVTSTDGKTLFLHVVGAVHVQAGSTE